MLRLAIVSSILVIILAEPIYLPSDRQKLLSLKGNFKELVKNSTNFIVGGEPAAPGETPYLCSLQRTSHSCGCSLISNECLVTAAHCVDGTPGSSLRIRCGSMAHASGGQYITVAHTITHPSYSSWTLDNDIAVVHVTSPFNLNPDTVYPIALPSEGSDPPAGANVLVAGWGTTSEGGSLPSSVQKLQVPIVGRAQCQQQYGGFNDVTDQMFCAGVPQGGKDSCQGDSGGPVVLNNQLVGAVSWGYGCARPNYPGVYTRVGSFIPWIKANTGV